MCAEDRLLKIDLKLALAAVFAALVCLATMIFTIPIPATSGYFNLGETVIYVAALLLGPYVGGLAGGIGAAIADMLVAPQFAPGTLVIKGCEGLLVGYSNRKLSSRTTRQSLVAVISMIAGGSIMIAGYFLYEQLVLSYPMITALTETPFNTVQMAVGIAVALPVARVIQNVFPQLKGGHSRIASDKETKAS
jgi:uncharacterized membrane protein